MNVPDIAEVAQRSGVPASTLRFYEMRGYQSAARVADFYAPGDHRVIYTKRFAGPAVHFTQIERGVVTS